MWYYNETTSLKTAPELGCACESHHGQYYPILHLLADTIFLAESLAQQYVHAVEQVHNKDLVHGEQLFGACHGELEIFDHTVYGALCAIGDLDGGGL